MHPPAAAPAPAPVKYPPPYSQLRARAYPAVRGGARRCPFNPHAHLRSLSLSLSCTRVHVHRGSVLTTATQTTQLPPATSLRRVGAVRLPRCARAVHDKRALSAPQAHPHPRAVRHVLRIQPVPHRPTAGSRTWARVRVCEIYRRAFRSMRSLRIHTCTFNPSIAVFTPPTTRPNPTVHLFIRLIHPQAQPPPAYVRAHPRTLSRTFTQGSHLTTWTGSRSASRSARRHLNPCTRF